MSDEPKHKVKTQKLKIKGTTKKQKLVLSPE
jgi:hypothetical protein